MGGTADFCVTDLTERGCRAVGPRLSGESVDALIDALRRAEETTDDEEEKRLLRRAAESALGRSNGISHRTVGDGLHALTRAYEYASIRRDFAPGLVPILASFQDAGRGF